ncbi:tRNA (adenosine(37)-N6)-threonylcarbamoyltransferase complex ATPase subunit type 1 TsaE [Neolewinella aurantiaca]|uniref:tRNA threonylcarbamoyladenosine biosynthesis protein TsaE n=1 Tax=Neolewinella aurantiaca TaxID=2602767 RepID=A0A5C7FSX6_9BACT|nr:tRNA (adenosine(37)-N6)-threonylcarbamoyltransferase complex ATPase subunit type 1 TsaE [Neolewinella aurantiaca]TXF89545.1 tRNA (adenosine(37)-N6)-threonylcarbamoyltransferase complex ATPase subunit type 1 TsaE [Neolewinella aurantiaca]
MHYTTDDIPALAAQLIEKLGRNRTYALLGELGAGKTTLVAEMCRQLGVTEPTSSPTFSIVNQYETTSGPVYHLDCYRLNSIQEALDAGLEELFAGHEDYPIFVEWPAVVEDLLPDSTVVLRLKHGEDGSSREITTSAEILP